MGKKESTIVLRNVWERWRRYSHIIELHAGILCTQAEEGDTYALGSRTHLFVLLHTGRERNDTWNVCVFTLCR